MIFGLCCSEDGADAALEAGFDYVELPANRLVEAESRYRILRPPATNVFFGGGMSLYGEGRKSAIDYASVRIRLAADVGVRTMVIGSGAARRSPEGMRPFDAEKAFVQFAGELSSLAEPLGIVIAPESLNRSETDVGNELRSLASALREQGVAYTADSYHVISEWVAEGGEGPVELGHWDDQVPYLPAHVHLGGRDRVDPSSDDPDLDGFVRRLFELGYDGRVSLECSRRPGWALQESLRQVRALFA